MKCPRPPLRSTNRRGELKASLAAVADPIPPATRAFVTVGGGNAPLPCIIFTSARSPSTSSAGFPRKMTWPSSTTKWRDWVIQVRIRASSGYSVVGVLRYRAWWSISAKASSGTLSTMAKVFSAALTRLLSSRSSNINQKLLPSAALQAFASSRINVFSVSMSTAYRGRLAWRRLPRPTRPGSLRPASRSFSKDLSLGLLTTTRSSCSK